MHERRKRRGSCAAENAEGCAKYGMKKLNVLITSANKQLSRVWEIIKELKGSRVDRKIYTCDMYPESVSGMVGSDGCFKVPICTSEDYVETIWSLCLGHNIGLIIPMTEKEFIILSANTELFVKNGVQVIHQGHTDDNLYGLGKKMRYAGEVI